MGWLTSRPGRFNPGNDMVPIVQGLNGPQGRSGRVRKISFLPGFDPRTVQPIVSHYTDWAIPAHIRWIQILQEESQIQNEI